MVVLNAHTCTMVKRETSSCQFSPICSLSSSAPCDKYAVADDTMPGVGKKERKRKARNSMSDENNDVGKQID